MHTRPWLVSLALVCSFPAARAQLIVSSTATEAALNPPTGYTWHIDVATGERTILFKGGFDGIGVDDANGTIYLAGGPLFRWNYGSAFGAGVQPQNLGPAFDANGGQVLTFNALAFGGGQLFGAKSQFVPSTQVGIYRIDLTTMQATKVALTPPPTHSPEGLAFNPADGMLYGVADIDVTTAMGLYRYDVLGSGAVTFVTALPPMGGGGDFDGLAIGNGRAYLIPDSHYSIAIWDFATQSYLPTPLPGAFVLEGYVCGGDWAPSLTLPNAPRIYCEGKVNSQNCHPLLGWKGLPSASAATTFEVIAAHMRPSVSCGLFYSLTGPANTPFGNGTLCLASPVLRTLTTTTITSTLQSCVGAATFDFNAFIASGANPSLVAGQTVWMQCLSRDPGFTPINGLGFSPALRATIQP